MEANFQRKVTIIRGVYCSLLCEFSNDNSFGTKSDFEFSSEKALCSINDLEHMSEIALFISSAQTFPSILWMQFSKFEVDAMILLCSSTCIRLIWIYFKGFLHCLIYVKSIAALTQSFFGHSRFMVVGRNGHLPTHAMFS